MWNVRQFVNESESNLIKKVHITSTLVDSHLRNRKTQEDNNLSQRPSRRHLALFNNHYIISLA